MDTKILKGILSQDQVEKISSEILSETFDKAREQLTGDCYVLITKYLHEHFINFEGDIWSQISSCIVNGGYGRWSKYDSKSLRSTILSENREDIIKEIGEDIVDENERLKKRIRYLQSPF